VGVWQKYRKSICSDQAGGFYADGLPCLVFSPSSTTKYFALLGVFTKQYHERIRIAEHDSAW
jgi:hypothetical protein